MNEQIMEIMTFIERANMDEQIIELMTYIDDISDELTSGVYKNIADRLMKMKSTSEKYEFHFRLCKVLKEQNDFYKEIVEKLLKGTPRMELGWRNLD